MSRKFITLVALVVLVIGTAACGDEDSSDGDSTSADAGSDTDGTNSDTGGTNSDTGGTNGDTGGGGNDTAAPQCDGDWTLGSTPMVGNDVGAACNTFNAPTNCLAGDWITFGSSSSFADQCICIIACADLNSNPQPGDACIDGWTCRQIEATGGNRGNYCVPNDWNICVQ